MNTFVLFMLYYFISYCNHIKTDNTMDIIYAPWRTTYNKSQNIEQECPFCSKFIETNDENNLIIKRLESCVIMLNLYPYGKGHILIIPYTHTSHLHELEKSQRAELMEAIAQTTTILENALQCDGINIGINKGKAAGGSVQSHLHIHILPRFIGDTNFLITGNTKVITHNIDQFYQEIKPYFYK